MTTLLLIVWGFLISAAVFVHAVRPQRSHHSWFELKRRGDEKAMHRERLLDDIYAVLHFLQLVIIVSLAAVSIVLWQGWGVPITVLAILVAQFIGKRKSLQRFATSSYAAHEDRILDYVGKLSWLMRFLGSEKHTPQDQRLESIEQLLHLVDSASHVLTSDQQRIIKRSVHWHSTRVKDIMTPRRSIVPIKRDELLGPLVLDDLHRSGFSRFPVIDGTIDNIVGILNITDLLEIDGDKTTHTVENTMTSRVLRIKSDDTLPVALKLLQKSHQNIIIVVDEEGRTEGILTLTDIGNSLLGE